MKPGILRKPASFYDRYERKSGVNKAFTHYCPGCGHGNVHKLIAEAIDDLEIQERTIFISPVGCSVFGYYYFDVGNIQAAHGRAPAVATGIKRVHPHSIVISYQGDGDLAGIGGNEILQAANRGENISVFFVNNAIYGMTGGQMAPTTLIGQRTTTSPRGRISDNEGFPLRVSELLATLEAPVYIERVSLANSKGVMKTRKAVRKALQAQIDNKGFSLVEILAPCPTGWGMDPVKARHWVDEVLTQQFPLGVYKDLIKDRKTAETKPVEYAPEKLKELLDITAKDYGVPEKTEISEAYRNPHIKVAGFGGQGILLLGIALAESGMEQNYHVSWLPSYGPEMRGGTANCHVIISEEEVASPFVSEPSVFIAMNQPSLEKFLPEVRPGGLVLYDDTFVKDLPEREDVEWIGVPASGIAKELGNVRFANIVMFGAYVGHTHVLSIDGILEALPNIIKRKELVADNARALQAGVKFVNDLEKSGKISRAFQETV